MKNVAALIVAVASCVLAVDSAEAAVNNRRAKALAEEMVRQAETTLAEISSGQIERTKLTPLAEIRSYGAKSLQLAEGMDQPRFTAAQAKKLADDLLALARVINQKAGKSGSQVLADRTKLWIRIASQLQAELSQMP